MIECYKIVYSEGQDEIIEKKSRFIASVKPIGSEEEAISFIDSLKKKHWNANHNCFAYVIGSDNEIQRCSDDKEPKGTAGRPMLDVLLGEEIHNVCVVVTRYFGGTLLGTGGLVRAYSRAVHAGLAATIIMEKRLAKKFKIVTDYNGIGKIQYLLGKRNITVLDSRYSDIIELEVLVPIGQAKDVKAEITEGTSGKAGIQELKDQYYGILEKKIVLFE